MSSFIYRSGDRRRMFNSRPVVAKATKEKKTQAIKAVEKKVKSSNKGATKRIFNRKTA